MSSHHQIKKRSIRLIIRYECMIFKLITKIHKSFALKGFVDFCNNLVQVNHLYHDSVKIQIYGEVSKLL